MFSLNLVWNKWSILLVSLLAVLSYAVAYEALAVAMPVVVYTGMVLAVLVGGITCAGYCVIRWHMIRTRVSELVNECEMAKLKTKAEEMRLQANQALAIAALQKVQEGVIYPSDLATGKFGHLPNQPQAKQIESQSVTTQDSSSEVIFSLPPKVDLAQLVPSTGPSIYSLALGIEATNQGLKPLTRPLSSLVHIGVGGSSGWGKSVFLQCLAIQIALAPEMAQMALIDIEAQTFSPFSSMNSSRLRYPLADNETDIMAIIEDLQGEWRKRRKLYQKHPEVANLDEYNQVAGQYLPPIVLMLDEVNMVSDNKDIMTGLTRLGQGTRKYGIFCVLGGQDWNAVSIPTKLRNNFSTRIQMKAMSKVQSRVMLEDSAAAEIKEPGRAFVVLPGKEVTELQTPYITKDDITRALTGLTVGQPPISPIQQPAEYEKVVLSAAETARSFNQLHHIVSGTGTNVSAKQIENYRQILDKFGKSINS